jgi:hypothetical protein
MAGRSSPHNGGGAPAKVQAGVAAALALSYNKLRRLDYSAADAKKLLARMCRVAINDLR